MAKPDKETTLVKLAASLSTQGVTSITVVDSDTVPDPAWFVVAHPAEVVLKVDFTVITTDEQKEAAKVIILAAKLKTKQQRKSANGVAKEITKLPVDSQTRLTKLIQGAWVRDPENKKQLDKWGYDKLDLDETVVL